MAINRESLDTIRKANGLAPLTDDEFKAIPGALDEEQTTAEPPQPVAAAPVVPEPTKDDPPAPKADPPAPQPVSTPELTDDQLLEIIAKKAGRKVTSWDDLKPAPEVIDAEKAKEERETNKFIWGLQQKKISKKDHESFINDSKDPEGLVYRLRLQEARKEDPDLDEAEFRSEFEEEFGLTAEDGTRRKKNGKDTINRLANEILKSTYSSIYSLENEFSQFEGQQTAAKQREEKIREGAPAYKKTLDTVKGELKRIKAQISEGEEYEVEVLDESIDRVITMMSDPDWASQQILSGYSPETLKDIAWRTVLTENFPFITKEIVKQALLKKAAGTKGIPVIGGTSQAAPEYNLTEAQKKLVQLSQQNAQPAVTN